MISIDLDETVMSLVNQAIYLYTHTLLRGKSHSEGVQAYKDNWLHIYLADLTFWPVV